MRKDSSSNPPGQKRSDAAMMNGSRVRELREKHELSQQELAERSGLHLNSVWKIENGITKVVSAEHAESLASALSVQPSELGLRIRPDAALTPRSIRFRQLTPDQRQLIDELMTFPPEDYTKIRAALNRLRNSKRRKARRDK